MCPLCFSVSCDRVFRVCNIQIANYDSYSRNQEGGTISFWCEIFLFFYFCGKMFKYIKRQKGNDMLAKGGRSIHVPTQLEAI